MGFIVFLERFFNPYIVTFIAAMTPIFELRAAIPLGVSLGLSPFAALVVSILGNIVPVPLIIIFIRRIFAWLREHIPKLGNFISRLERKATSKQDFIQKWQFWGLFLLVAIPLPSTGAWTGALVAALMDMRMKRALPSISLGVIAAGLIVTVITYGAMGIFS